MIREIICISCPIGCHMSVSWEKSNELKAEEITVDGNSCPRGEIYGREEVLAPKRVVTSTCAINSKNMARIPVKTNGPVLKQHVKELLDSMYALNLSVPVRLGDVIIENFKGSGVNLLASRTLEE